MVRALPGISMLLAALLFTGHDVAAAPGTLTNIVASVNVQETPDAAPVTLQGVLSIIGFAESPSGGGVVVTAVVSAKSSDDSTTPIVNQVIEAETVISSTGSTRRGCGGVQLDIGPDILGNGRTVDVQPVSLNFATIKEVKAVKNALCTIARALLQPLLKEPQPEQILIALLLPAIQKLNGYIEADNLYLIPVNGQVVTPGGASAALNGLLTIDAVADGASNTLLIQGILNGTIVGANQTVPVVNAPVTASLTVDGGAGADYLTYKLEDVLISSFSASLDPFTLSVPAGSGNDQIIGVLIALMQQKNTTGPSRSVAAKIRKLNALLQRI